MSSHTTLNSAGVVARVFSAAAIPGLKYAEAAVSEAAVLRQQYQNCCLRQQYQNCCLS
jgi:hypothetical protein